MSQKDRERQKRRQKRGERHKQKRAGVPHRVASQPDGAEIRRQAMGALIEDCRALFARESRIGDDLRGDIREAGDYLGGVWARLVFELEGFLYQGRPWDLRCDELRPLRWHFQNIDAEPVFDRIWTLCRSNDPELYAPTASDPGPDPSTGLDRAGRMAFAFWRLHTGLEAPKEDRALALKAIREQVGKLTESKTARALCDLLNTALSSLLPAGRGRKPAVPREVQLARDAETFLRTHVRAHAEAGWWASSRMLFREVLHRHVRSRGSAWLFEHPELLEALYGAPIATLCHPPAEVERRLQAIHPDRECEEWLGFLVERIDREALGFEHRVRYEIARTRLLKARAGQIPTDVSVGERRDLTDAFESLFGLLGRGVPPEERHLPPVLEPIVLDYYTETCRTLAIFTTNLRLSEALMRRHPEDHRLACLYATGALSNRPTVSGPIGVVESGAETRSWSHVEPELFAECADHWRAGQDRARALLYTPLAREEQKQCVLALTRRRLRAVSTPEACRAAVEGLTPYLEAVHEALSHGAALERELVFVGALTAAWRGMPLPALSYAAFIQLAGYAAALCRELPPAEGLVIEFLERHPERWFTRADGWQRLEALSEAFPERLFRKLRPALKRLLGRLPLPNLGGAGHQRLLRRLGIPVQRRRSPGGRTAVPENAAGPRRSIPPKKTIKQGELFDDLGP